MQPGSAASQPAPVGGLTRVDAEESRYRDFRHVIQLRTSLFHSDSISPRVNLRHCVTAHFAMHATCSKVVVCIPTLADTGNVMKKALVLALLLLLGPLPLAAEQFYKWTDESGNTHYSQNPPPGVEAQTLDIRTRSPGPRRQANQGDNPQSNAQDDRDDGQQSTESEEGEARPDREAVAEARRRNCERAKEALETLANNARVQVRDDDGQRRYLSPEEKESQRKRYAKMRDENCE